MEFENDNKKINRTECPHHATITLKIDIRKMNPDGTLDHAIIGNRLLSKYGITTKAQWCTSGPSEADCIKKAKEALERFNG
jgi:hypothetical protein|tara:strand:- start:568 stop:810 length:243 start_codon:yes stop_codon:yes gene_type:complete